MAKVTKKAHMIVLFLMVQRHNSILIITLMTLSMVQLVYHIEPKIA